MVVFFSSYAYLDEVVAQWDKRGASQSESTLSRLGSIKRVSLHRSLHLKISHDDDGGTNKDIHPDIP